MMPALFNTVPLASPPFCTISSAAVTVASLVTPLPDTTSVPPSPTVALTEAPPATNISPPLRVAPLSTPPRSVSSPPSMIVPLAKPPGSAEGTRRARRRCRPPCR